MSVIIDEVLVLGAIGHSNEYRRILIPWPGIRTKVGQLLYLNESKWTIVPAYNGHIVKRRR